MDMIFSSDLVNIFRAKTGNYNRVKNEVFLFRALIASIYEAASKNGHEAGVLEIHKSYINFVEIAGKSFYNRKDRGKCVSCELADIMFIVYSDKEVRLCFMQNKYDRRTCEKLDFKADTRQLYVLKNRPQFWKGRKHTRAQKMENILHAAQYNSITNYGVFVYDIWGDCYDMRYYNADSIITPANQGRTSTVKFDETYAWFSTINTPDDQLNYAFTLREFGEGLEKLKIGQRYRNVDELLEATNTEAVINYFQERGETDVEYDAERGSISAKYAVIIKLQHEI